MNITATSTFRVVLAGATGKTGNAIAHGLAGHKVVKWVSFVSPSAADNPSRQLPEGVDRASELSAVTADVDVLVDVTNAETAIGNLEVALDRNWHVVLGTTGIADSMLEDFGNRFADKGLGLLYAPNFALGAVLMMHFSQLAAQYFPDVEISETHNPLKLDAPSGTARRTAQLIAAARPNRGISTEQSPARGEIVDGVPVHSLRLPGAVAHQEVVFASPTERFAIKHDAIDRGCYAAGVALAVSRVVELRGLTIGLEHVL